LERIPSPPCLVRVQEAADQRGLARALRSDDEEDGVGPALVCGTCAYGGEGTHYKA